MTTPAQHRRNVQNAKHSTGPRTEVGKRNARKHGFTARVILLPGEKPVEFNQRVNMYFTSFLPQDDYEVSLAEEAAYSSWQMERCRRAGMARACVKAITGEIDEQRKEETAAIELSQSLFRAPYGRPAACPRGIMPDAEAGKAWPGNYDLDDRPRLVIIRLEANSFGPLQLLNEWHTLEAPLQRGEGWNASERFRAFRLLGIHPIDAMLDTKLTSLLRACEVLDPAAGSLVGEVWNELVSATDLPEIENQYRQAIAYRPAMDRETAREHLISIVQGQVTRLESLAQEHRERTEFLAALQPTLGAFDTSREGLLVLRYEFAWLRLMERNRNELRKRYEARHTDGPPGPGHDYMRPSPGWVLPEDETGEDACERDHDDFDDLGDEAAEVCAVAESREDEVDQVAEAATVRNEPKGVSGLEDMRLEEPETRVRNEPKVESDAEVVAVEGGLRNEPNGGVRGPRVPLSSTLQGDGNGFDASGSFARIMTGAMRGLDRDLPVPAIRLASAGELVRGATAGGGSRRERMRRKAEARARAKSC